MSNTNSITNRRTKSRDNKLEAKRSTAYNWREHDAQEPAVSRNERRQLENYNRRRAQAISKGQGDKTSGSPVLNRNKFFDYHQASKSPSRTMSQSSNSVSKLADARKEEERKAAEKVRLAEEKAKLAKAKAAEDEAKRLQALEDEVFTDNEDEDPDSREIQALIKSVDLSESDEETDLTDRIYEASNDLMKSTMAKAIHLSESSFKDHRALRRVWDKAVVAWQDFEGIALGIMRKEKSLVQKEAATKRIGYFHKAADYFEENQKKVRKRIRHIRCRDERDALRKTEIENGYKKTAMAATTGNIAKDTAPEEKSPEIPTTGPKSKEERQEQAEITMVEAVKRAEAAQRIIEGNVRGLDKVQPGSEE
jgi:hypothetical protein